MFSRVEKNWTTSLFFFFGSFSPIQRIQWNTNCIFSAVSTKGTKKEIHQVYICDFFILNAASNWGHTWNAASIQISIFISVRKLNFHCIWLYSGFWQITLGTDTLYSRTGACVHVWKKKKKRRVLNVPGGSSSSSSRHVKVRVRGALDSEAKQVSSLSYSRQKRAPCLVLDWNEKALSRNPPNTH